MYTTTARQGLRGNHFFNRLLEPMGEKGTFELRFIRDGKAYSITQSGGDMLHDLLNSIEADE